VTIGNTGKEKVKGGGAGLEEEKAAKSKDAVAPGPEAPEAPQLRAGEIPKSTKKETDDKLRNSKKGTLSHLHGSRLALCVSSPSELSRPKNKLIGFYRCHISHLKALGVIEHYGRLSV
jgi:hypothetical protein